MDQLSSDRIIAIERACHRLTLQYGLYLDTYRDDALAALFTDDAVWERPGQASLQGAEAIRNFLVSRDRVLMFHVLSNFLLEHASEQEARGVSCFTAYRDDNGKPGEIAASRAPFSAGRYHDRFRMTRDGWRICHRITEHVFTPGALAVPQWPVP
ncbi:SnoaL-like domain protein [compost metagenome]